MGMEELRGHYRTWCCVFGWDTGFPERTPFPTRFREIRSLITHPLNRLTQLPNRKKSISLTSKTISPTSSLNSSIPSTRKQHLRRIPLSLDEGSYVLSSTTVAPPPPSFCGGSLTLATCGWLCRNCRSALRR